MAKARLYQRLRTEGFPWIVCETAKNGTPKPDPAAFQFGVRYSLDGKRKLETAATLDEAVAILKTTNVRLYASRNGVDLPDAGKPTSARVKFLDAVTEYKAETKEHKAHATYRAYCASLDLFVKGCNKTYVDEIERGCMMAFVVALKKEGYAERTVAMYFRHVYTFLKRHGKNGIVGKNDWPKYEDIEHEIYSEDDVRKILEACETLKERALILFASGTGFRHGEIAHSEIGDIDFKAGDIQTCAKPRFGFKTKDHEQRIVPVSDTILQTFKEYCPTLTSTLLFPTRTGTPDKHLDHIVARIVKRAGVKLPKSPMHAFRALYATSLVRQGVDIYTVQRFLGHSDIETTQGYLRAVKRNDPKLRAQVNAAWFGSLRLKVVA